MFTALRYHTQAMPTITPIDLFIAFFQIGLQGFGGVLPWARRVLVEQRRWLSAEEFLEQWSVCQALPGGNICNLSVAFGLRCAGATGAACALLGLVFAPFLVFCAIGFAYTRYGALPQAEGLLRGVSAVGAGLVLATGLRMAASPRMRSPLVLFALAAFVLTALLRWPLLLVFAVLLPLSLVAAWRRQ
jgi:chromate transporter